jgi:hypothetical protein
MSHDSACQILMHSTLAADRVLYLRVQNHMLDSVGGHACVCLSACLHAPSLCSQASLLGMPSTNPTTAVCIGICAQACALQLVWAGEASWPSPPASPFIGSLASMRCQVSERSHLPPAACGRKTQESGFVLNMLCSVCAGDNTRPSPPASPFIGSRASKTYHVPVLLPVYAGPAACSSSLDSASRSPLHSVRTLDYSSLFANTHRTVLLTRRPPAAY